MIPAAYNLLCCILNISGGNCTAPEMISTPKCSPIPLQNDPHFRVAVHFGGCTATPYNSVHRQARPKRVCFCFYQLVLPAFVDTGLPEGIGLNGTHRSHARCHPYPIPQPVKVGHTTGVYVPYTFQTLVWVLLRPTRTDQWKCCETGPTVFRPYPRRLESLIICRCPYKGSTFLKTLSVGPAGVWTPRPPAQQTGPLSNYGANQAAVPFTGFGYMKGSANLSFTCLKRTTDSKRLTGAFLLPN